MPLITTQPLRIGDHMRPPGYQLTGEDIEGRNIDAMKRHGHVAFVSAEEARKSSSRPARKSSSRPADD